jgi:hypothetical protein
VENGNWLSTVEVGKRTGRTEGAIYQMARKGKFENIKKGITEAGRKGYLIHESELEKFLNGKSPARKMLNAQKGNPIPSISEADYKPVKLKVLKNFKVEKGKIPYINLEMAVGMACEHKTWDQIYFATGVREMLVKRLITEVQTAENAEPGKYETVMDYLRAGRPYLYGNKKLPRKGK